MLTNAQAKAALFEGKKLTHSYFTKSEWVKGCGYQYEFEDGCRCSPDDFWSIREDFPPEWKLIE
ncbi:hypothetical protein ACJPQX_20920 [Vibrio vulnificus]|uniref:hypothetical protein n=1 Tax=Vibrio vulnificus TaxID=672 RepID=UPI003D9CB75B